MRKDSLFHGCCVCLDNKDKNYIKIIHIKANIFTQYIRNRPVYNKYVTNKPHTALSPLKGL